MQSTGNENPTVFSLSVVYKEHCPLITINLRCILLLKLSQAKYPVRGPAPCAPLSTVTWTTTPVINN